MGQCCGRCWLAVTPEEQYVLLMDAAYRATDKETYYALMQKADQVLKSRSYVSETFDQQAA